MAVQGLQKNGMPRLDEGRRLKELFECIPRTTGVFITTRLTLTCLDAGDELLVLGSDAGTVYVYEKSRKRTGMLPTQGKSNSVSCVKMFEGKRRVAFGCVSGNVFIFQIQLEVGHKLKTFTLSKEHVSTVTCLAWHGDGQFLISGDEQGKIIISSIDFVQNRHNIRVLHETDSPIVQLSAGVAQDWVVVSTMKKSYLLCSELHLRKEPIPIGQKDRKIGPYGACLRCSDKEQVSVYVARPGLRLWKANIHGKVSATLQYRDVLTSSQGPAIQMYTIHSVPGQRCDDGQFHDLQLLADRYIVTHCDNNLWVLDPDNNSVLGCHGNLGKIMDIATTNSEIFVLRDDTECPVLTITFHPSVLHVRQAAIQQKPLQAVEEPTKEEIHSDKSTEEVHFVQSQQKTETLFLVLPADEATENVSASPELLQSFEKSSDGLQLSSEHQALEDGIDNQQHVEQPTALSPSGGASQDEEKKQEGDIDVQQQGGEEEAVNKHDSFHEKALKRERFQQISQSTFPDEIVFNPKKEKKKKKSRQKKKAKSTSTLSLSGTETPELRSASVEPDFLPVTGDRHSVPPSHEASPLGDSGHELVCGGEGQNVKIRVERFDELEVSGLLSTVAYHCSSRQSPMLGVDDGLSSQGGRKSPLDGSGKNSPVVHHSQSGRNSPISVSGRQSPVCDVLGLNAVDHGRNSPASFSGRNSPILSHDTLGTVETTETRSGSVSPASDSAAHMSPIPGESENQMPKEQQATDFTSGTVSGDGSSAVAGNMPNCDTENDHTNNVSSQRRAASSPLLDNSDNHHDFSAAMGVSIYDKFKWEDSLSVSKTQEELDDPDEDQATADNSGEHENSSSMPTCASSAHGFSVTAVSSLSQSATTFDSGDQRLMDGWTPYSYPSKFHINCAALSNNHVFVIDSRERTFMAKIGGASGKWKKIDGYLKQISVSPSGLHILGVTSKNHLYVRLGVTSNHPSGKGWEKVDNDIACIAVEDSQMWGLRKDGTPVHSSVIPNTEKQKARWHNLEDALGQSLSLVQVTAYKGVVWARDKIGTVYYRAGVSAVARQGSRWKAMEDGLETTHICLGGQQAGWAVSSSGTVLFKQGVTQEKPGGESRWWEILLSDYRVEDASLINSFLSWVKPFDSSLKLVVANAEAGVCVLTGNSSIHVSNTALLGSHYEGVNLLGIPQSATNWLCVAAGSLSSPQTGLVWAVRRNGEIFCLPSNARPFSVDPPSSAKLTLLTASEVAVWALVGDTVIVREGINSYCPQGVAWRKADTITMKSSPVRWLSCGRTTVWAVDQVGRAWLRMVTDPSQHAHSSPVWLEIEGRLTLGFTLSRVAVAPDDSMVWAVDTRGNVYARMGVTDGFPAGRDWEYVAGAQVKELVASKTAVWAVSVSGEMFCRFGISQSNCSGDYWKKVVGSFSQISVTSFDQVWGIDKDGQMFSRHTVAYAGSQFTCNAGSLQNEGWDVI